jgi:hypothetical protein
MSLAQSQHQLQLPVQVTVDWPVKQVPQHITDKFRQSSMCNEKHSAAAAAAMEAVSEAATTAQGGSDMQNNLGLFGGSEGMQPILERVQVWSEQSSACCDLQPDLFCALVQRCELLLLLMEAADGGLLRCE